MKKFLFTALLLMMACSFAAADTNPVFQFTSSQPGWNDNRPFTLGFEFTTSVTFDVNALGYWDDGLQNNHQVGLWDTTGTLLTSTTVLGTDSTTAGFVFHPIPGYILSPGTYVIGGEFLGGDFPAYAQGITTLPGYTWITDEQFLGGGLNFPTSSYGYGDNGIALVNFSVQSESVQPVPEPASLLLLGTGLAGLVGTVRRRLHR